MKNCPASITLAGRFYAAVKPRASLPVMCGRCPHAFVSLKLWSHHCIVAHEGTHDLVAVQHLLGHASVATTQRYVAVRDDSMRRAMEAAA